MNKLDENYYLRKCFFERNQVPTQKLMKEKMCKSLAKVYFKSMTPKLKVLAGLEPPLRGGGTDWFMHPEDLLNGRIVLKPFKKRYLSRLGFYGITDCGDKLVADHKKHMEAKKKALLDANDAKWKMNIEKWLKEVKEITTEDAARENTEMIRAAIQEYETIFVTSFTKIESLMYDAAYEEAERVRTETIRNMQDRYETLLKSQATVLHDTYKDRLEAEKARIKKHFIQSLELTRTELGNTLHDINMDKFVAVEKLRHLLECQNLACQVYVALKEQETHKQQTEQMEQDHKRAVKLLTDQLAKKDVEIKIAQEKQEAAEAYKILWKKKVCHVVKRFQLFVSYCLRNLPEYAEFFINMERLMMIQIAEAVDNPETENMFEPEEEPVPTVVAQPKPFVLIGDLSYKPELDLNLCPKSSASQLPVVLINKRCIYAACDNFQVFSDRVEKFMSDNLENDLVDDHDYTYSVPVKYTESQRIEDLKLEGSLMQLVQKEIANIRNVTIPSCPCGFSNCFCGQKSTQKTLPEKAPEPTGSQVEICPSRTLSRDEMLKHEREPQITSVECKCRDIPHELFHDYLPPYMKMTSKYGPSILPDYEPCTVETINMLVENARKKREKKVVERPPLQTFKVTFTQTPEEVDFYALCNCLSDQEVQNLCHRNFNRKTLIRDKNYLTSWSHHAEVVTGGSPDLSYIDQSILSFATDRVLSLRMLVDETPALEEIFGKSDCNYD